MIKILTVTDWYLPAFKAGGPVRSLSNLVATLAGSEFEFFVLTRDRDLRDPTPYLGIPLESWTSGGQAKVFYTAHLSLGNIRRRIGEIKPDVIYLNSAFSTLSIKVLVLRRLKLIAAAAVVLAPRGEFSGGALTLKSVRKRVYLWMLLELLYDGLTWQASTEHELEQIRNTLNRYGPPKRFNLQLARNFHTPDTRAELTEANISHSQFPSKSPGAVRFIFLSRISRMKNLTHAIDTCNAIKGEVALDIYGPQEDPVFWAESQRLIQSAPANVNIRYCGMVPAADVQNIIRQYHFLILPTLGENFGHVIVESLSAGCPVIISDQTPWRDLESKNIGWDLPLSDRQRWVEVLQRTAEMDDQTYRSMAMDCRRFFLDWTSSPAIREENVRLFARALLDTSKFSL
jgi:glycosyltransferase involved in cell wall biosynthesis